jgi:citronellol/citronellal dehydrogenase
LVARTRAAHPTLPGSLERTAERVRIRGGEVAIVVADLADDGARADIVARVAAELGPVDILVNNAAAAIYEPLTACSLKRRRLMMEVNLHAPVDLAQQAVPAMIERGAGWIVNVSSGSAVHPDGPPFRTEGLAPTIGFYGATKAALNRITTGLAVELHGTGVRVNTIEPRAAVLSEGAVELAGDVLTADQIEPLESMVQATLELCDCPADHTGRVEVSLDLLELAAARVLGLDGTPIPPT